MEAAENVLYLPPPAGGLLLRHCLPGSPAAAIGLRAGDIVLYVNGRRVDSIEDYVAARRIYDDRIDVRVFRENQFLELTIDLPKRTPTPLASSSPVDA